MKIKQWWRRFERWLLGEPTFDTLRPPALPEEVNEPGIWYQRSEQPIRHMLRVFLTGNPPLNKQLPMFELKEELLQLMSRLGVADMDVRIYANYIAIEHSNPGTEYGKASGTGILSDEFVTAAVQAIAATLGWKDVPQPVEFMTDEARHQLDEKFGWRWPLGR